MFPDVQMHPDRGNIRQSFYKGLALTRVNRQKRAQHRAAFCPQMDVIASSVRTLPQPNEGDDEVRETGKQSIVMSSRVTAHTKGLGSNKEVWLCVSF